MSLSIPSNPSAEFEAVTPNDATNLSGVRSLYIGGAGDVAISTDDAPGTSVTFSNVAAGSILPIAAARVFSTGTTATNIVALK